MRSLQRAGFTHLVHFFRFKPSTLILPASMREFNDGHRMFLQYKFYKKEKKKAEKQMFKFHWNNNKQTKAMCALKRLAYLHWMPCSLTWKSNFSLDTDLSVIQFVAYERYSATMQALLQFYNHFFYKNRTSTAKMTFQKRYFFSSSEKLPNESIIPSCRVL